MPRNFHAFGAGWIMLALAVLLCPALPVRAQAPGRVILRGHRPPATLRADALGRVVPAAPVSLALALPLRNTAALDDLLRRLYDPADPQFGHFLTPTQFTAQFGPTAVDYGRVIAYARSQGLTVTGTHTDRLLLDVTGAASVAERAFGVHLQQFQAADGRMFRAPDAEPSVPAALAGRLVGVIGLDTAAVRRPHRRGLAFPRTIGSGPGGGLSPSDIKAAYGLSSTALDGTGQTLAVLELDGYTRSDIAGYESAFGLRAVPLQDVLEPGGTTTPSRGANSGADEVTLDIELQTALAPGADKIMVYEAGNSDQDILDAYSRMATDDEAKQISTCWGGPEDQTSTSTLDAENVLFQKMAAQGQAVFAAAGDNGAYDDGSGLSVDDPAAQPFVTGVGGTTLTTRGRGGPWAGETAWNSGGGGASGQWPLPTYQQGVVSPGSLASTMWRNVPDVSLNADPDTGDAIFYGGQWITYGGTSCAAPLWAGFTALVNQQRAAAGEGVLGFANPAIYKIGVGPSGIYAADFHDIADGSTNQFYPAVSGFDDATGWGSFGGTGLVQDLAGLTGRVGTTTPSPPTVATAPTATPDPVTGTATGLRVLGSDAGGESGLTYTWAASGPAPVAFSPNGTNAAKDASAAFQSSGFYTIIVTIRNAAGVTASDSVAVTVLQTPTTVQVDPAAASVSSGSEQTFTATVIDQFGTAVSSPTVTWTVPVAAGTVSPGGLLTAGTTAGSFTVAAASGSATGSALVTVIVPPATTTVSDPSVTLPAGWSLFSLPYDESGVSPASLFGLGGVTLDVWNPSIGQYLTTPNSPADTVRLGGAYWVYLSQSVTLHPAGPTASAAVPFSIPLARGWNQIGDPFTRTVPVSGLYVVSGDQTETFGQAVGGGLISATLFRYDNGSGHYMAVGAADSLSPNAGYWIYALQPVTLLVAP